MSPTVAIGLLLALATALASIVGFLYKHRGAVHSPRIDGRAPIRGSLALFRSRWYLLGLAIATVGWGLHVAALALAPISLVQSVIAGSLVLLTVVADRAFGLQVTRREWIGVALTALGLAFLAATLEGAASESHSDYAPGVLTFYVTLLSAAGLMAMFAGWGRNALVLAVSAGLLWGASDVSIKALSGELGTSVAFLLDPLTGVILIASLIGLTVSARSLQDGRAVPVIAATCAAANLSTIASGPIVFKEPLPSDPLALAVRLLAFALVIVAASLTPPPLRTSET